MAKLKGTTICFYSADPLIWMLRNSNFRYFELIFKSLEFALRNSYVLCCLIRTLVIGTFCYFELFLGPLPKKRAH